MDEHFVSSLPTLWDPCFRQAPFAVQRAISWLHTTGLHIDAKQRSVGKDTVNL
jgi:hypothetical protein